ncbi:hypothetical protein CC80DRAFT_543957 [Byssothecium circinans]|uniref:Uncharacterized protein n=1 Tax=Byssothecium circinans TaxID=147558 RepID=A0A6A5U6L8_9PLEO|nr:hypothetical protein CC80DRAFT_543957 [Byssothecium circinans]
MSQQGASMERRVASPAETWTLRWNGAGPAQKRRSDSAKIAGGASSASEARGTERKCRVAIIGFLVEEQAKTVLTSGTDAQQQQLLIDAVTGLISVLRGPWTVDRGEAPALPGAIRMQACFAALGSVLKRARQGTLRHNNIAGRASSKRQLLMRLRIVISFSR